MPLIDDSSVNPEIGNINKIIILRRVCQSVRALGRQRLTAVGQSMKRATLENLHVVRLASTKSICWGEQNLNLPESVIRR
ncbi:hypothetical protein [Aminobacter ciceronei]|jgi:hypothetical protein|uniref:hypothetical protein n=1 Tax=Aminobacter ciceronei TaxID=150723 RepID=UPI0015FD7885|nr:hypothetical protein [Aminobacter ciceronei]